MNKHVLSKSTFLLGDRCHKALYLNKRFPKLKNKMTVEKKHKFETGQKVGKLAHKLFPGGVEVGILSFGNLQKAVSHTAKLIEEGANIIYEAVIQFDEVLVLPDILVKGSNGWTIYEVKSSTGLKPEHTYDTAVQYYVVTKVGLPVEDIFLVHINNEYVRSGKIDVEALFTVESVRESVLSVQDDVEQIIPELKQVLTLPEIPHIDIGDYCYKPYECDFTGYCWQHIPENSVFELADMHMPKKISLYRSGVLTLDQVQNEYPLSNSQLLQVKSFKTKSNYIDRDAIQGFIAGISYPIHFLDFETYDSAIPLYNSTRPYQKIPFQFSLHVKESENTDLKHYEFLGLPQEDPRQELIEQLLDIMGNEGSIIVYHKTFEIGRLQDLSRHFPEYEAQINSIIERIIDLEVPFKEGHYYVPAMHVSSSIKAVLPALVSDLDYSDLEVADGKSAMYAYEQLLNETEESRINQIRHNLLEYCKRDTIAMVRVLEVLRDINGGKA